MSTGNEFAGKGFANHAELLGAWGVGPVLHAIDFEDVALTREGVRLIELGARAVLRRFMPGLGRDELPRSQAVALFLDRVFWEERSGGLVLCAEMAERSLCLPLPSRCWSVRTDGAVLH